MELTVTNRSRAYPGRSSEDSKVDDVQYVVLKVCYLCTSGSVVEYRLAKARVAGSNPVSCSQRDRKKSHPMDGSFFYVRALPGSNGSNVSAPLRSSQSNVPRTFCDVSCSQEDAKKRRYPSDISSFSHLRALLGSNGLKSWLRSGRSPAMSCAFLTRISKNSPTSIGGEMNCHLLHSAIVGM